jgi:hypothetical protein
LGFDLTQHPKKKRKGSFQIFRINPGTFESFKNDVALAEISRKTEEQIRIAYKNYFKDPFFSKDPAKKTWKGLSKADFLKKAAESYLVTTRVEKTFKDQFQHDYELAKSGHSESTSCNLDPSISCKALASLLGYQWASQGYLIQQRLKAADLIEIENRKVNLGYYSEKDASKFKGDSSFYHQPITNLLFKQLPNLITIL